jgi:hypothetical protein
MKVQENQIEGYASMVRDNLERFLFGYASMLDAIKPKKNLFLRDSSISIISNEFMEREPIS